MIIFTILLAIKVALVVYWLAYELLAMVFGNVMRRIRLYPLIFLVFWAEAWKQGWDVYQCSILAGWNAKWWVRQQRTLPHPWGVRVARWFL